ncbi:MAG TPA: peptidase [Pirellulales bacterium]|nr:peptidase [Pirellulales bacterium]
MIFSPRRPSTALRFACLGGLIALGGWAQVATPARAEQLRMRDDRLLEGVLGRVSGLADNPNVTKPSEAATPQILFLDDNLRRTFFHSSQVRQAEEGKQRLVPQKIIIPQRVAIGPKRIGKMGPILKITPFDEYGRRTVTMNTESGPVDVIQGITEITPLYTKVEGLMAGRSYLWDMRIATSSIPRETLAKILSKVTDPKKLEDRMKLVRLLFDSERYADAQAELEAVVHDFPAQAELEKEVRAIRQLQARKVIDEINLRRQAGQDRLAYGLLQNFPRDQIAGETLQLIRQMVDRYDEIQRQGKDLLASIEKNLAGIKDSQLRKKAAVVVDEIKTELNINTLDRLSDYAGLVNSEKMSDEEKLSLAISGWLLGSNHASTNLAVALSLYEVRGKVQDFLREPKKTERAAILTTLHAMEGSTCEMVARLVGHMKPPIDPPEADAGKPGFYTLSVPALQHDEPNVTYYLQLPPDYDPYRHYPMIVTLNGAGSTPQQQLDWWAGEADENGNRLGQAMRQGYIVMAVEWTKTAQIAYEFSAREHFAVLFSLRDACRRFSIDTDRVFLSGHSMGGDAAWDIGTAHPDQWAGVIPIVAVAEKYALHYWHNARLVPFYVVGGELDGDKMATNSKVLDRYLINRFDVTVVEYEGRGHEHFHDEILRIFDWMGRHKRDFFPKKFSVATMRSWDNSFWWLGLADFPASGIIDPINWEQRRGFQPVRVDASIKGNSVYVTTGADKVTVWLSPELVDFSKPVRIDVKGQRLNRDPNLVPDLATLLDDVRARGDRQHPFWVKVDRDAVK